MERKVGDEHVDDNLDLNNRKSHPDAGLRWYEMRVERKNERPIFHTLGPTEKDIRFEYRPGCAFAASGRLSQRSGLCPQNNINNQFEDKEGSHT